MNSNLTAIISEQKKKNSSERVNIEGVVLKTVSDFIKHSAEYLKKKNIDDPRLNVELMLCHILKCDRMRLYLNFDKPLNETEKNRLRDFLKRRAGREPLQYILGWTEFYGMKFNVNKNVLIPRPETELLVEKILNAITESGTKNVSILEIGSGSGCISIALAGKLSEKKIDYKIHSIDDSEKAIELAKENLKLNCPGTNNVEFIVKDVFEMIELKNEFDYIISNPPYISAGDYIKLEPEIKYFEPESALTDHADGFRFYKKIFDLALTDNFKGEIFVEIGFGQKEKIKELLKDYQFSELHIFRDYNEIDRIIRIKKNKE